MNKTAYAIRHPHGFYKIGASKQPFGRYNLLRSGSPYQLELYAVLVTPYDDNRVESEIHDQLGFYHQKREWFNAPMEVVDNVLEAHARKDGFELSYPRLNNPDSAEKIAEQERDMFRNPEL